MTPDLVIFDCDGVLVDSEPVTDQVIQANLARYGLPLSRSEVHNLFVGGTMASAGEEARRRNAKLPANWLDEIYTEVFTALARGVPLMPGIETLLDQLDRAGIATAIASNGPQKKMEITLTPSGLWHRFQGRVFSGHDTGMAPKPAPTMINRIMEKMGTTAARTVFIDDSPNGTAAGIAAGVTTFGLDPDQTRHYHSDVRPLRRLMDLPPLLGML